MTLKYTSSVLYRVMIDNVILERYSDLDGVVNCNKCGCPLLMHFRATHCGPQGKACKNPKCEVTRRAIEKSNKTIRDANGRFLSANASDE
jgi:hypothetical protein